MASTKTKNETFSDLAAEVGQQLLDNRRSVLAKADEILEKQIQENRPLAFDELDFLTSVVGWDRIQINDATRRVGRRINNQAIAGTSKDREELDRLSAAAKAALATRGPVISEQIAKLQAELTALEKEASTLERRQEQVNAALDNLTKCVSPAVQASCDAKRATVKSTLGRELGDLKTDLQQIKTLLAGPRDSTDIFYWENLRRFDRELVSISVEGQTQSYGYSPAWPAKKSELASQVEQRESEIEQLEIRLADELDAIQVELRQYWR